MIKAFAPAKINLSLKIVGIRSDGYHLIQSLFAPISLFDEVKINPSEKDNVQFSLSDGKTLEISNDTVTKALKLFKAATKKDTCFEIKIKKNIPWGAGLGGGSSDAATVLTYLNKVCDFPLSKRELSQLGSKIGADVCFFLQPKPALVSGIGEVIEPCDLEKFHLVVAKPSFGVSTVEAYGWYDQTKPNFGQVSKNFQSKNGLTLVEILANLYNSLEKPVEEKHPEIRVLKDALIRTGARGSLMSGSGSCVYGIFNNSTEAQKSAKTLKAENPGTEFFVCEVLTGEQQQGEQHGDHRS